MRGYEKLFQLKEQLPSGEAGGEGGDTNSMKAYKKAHKDCLNALKIKRSVLERNILAYATTLSAYAHDISDATEKQKYEEIGSSNKIKKYMEARPTNPKNKVCIFKLHLEKKGNFFKGYGENTSDITERERPIINQFRKVHKDIIDKLHRELKKKQDKAKREGHSYNENEVVDISHIQTLKEKQDEWNKYERLCMEVSKNCDRENKANIEGLLIEYPKAPNQIATLQWRKKMVGSLDGKSEEPIYFLQLCLWQTNQTFSWIEKINIEQMNTDGETDFYTYYDISETEGNISQHKLTFIHNIFNEM